MTDTNGSYFIVYSTEEGGYFKAATDAAGRIIQSTREDFERTKETGYLNLWRQQVRPKYIALVKVEDNHDFVLGRQRDALDRSAA